MHPRDGPRATYFGPSRGDGLSGRILLPPRPGAFALGTNILEIRPLAELARRRSPSRRLLGLIPRAPQVTEASDQRTQHGDHAQSGNE
jgi:hypothetical protein